MCNKTGTNIFESLLETCLRKNGLRKNCLNNNFRENPDLQNVDLEQLCGWTRTNRERERPISWSIIHLLNKLLNKRLNKGLNKNLFYWFDSANYRSLYVSAAENNHESGFSQITATQRLHRVYHELFSQRILAKVWTGEIQNISKLVRNWRHSLRG